MLSKSALSVSLIHWQLSFIEVIEIISIMTWSCWGYIDRQTAAWPALTVTFYQLCMIWITCVEVKTLIELLLMVILKPEACLCRYNSYNWLSSVNNAPMGAFTPTQVVQIMQSWQNAQPAAVYLPSTVNATTNATACIPSTASRYHSSHYFVVVSVVVCVHLCGHCICKQPVAKNPISIRSSRIIKS